MKETGMPDDLDPGEDPEHEASNDASSSTGSEEAPDTATDEREPALSREDQILADREAFLARIEAQRVAASKASGKRRPWWRRISRP